MRILILEDEPIIAIDLEEIVLSKLDAEVVVASTAEEGLRHLAQGIDFAMLDINLGSPRTTSLPVAKQLLKKRIPFCFISSSLETLPNNFGAVPRVSKPFRATEIAGVLPAAAA